jgi:hypothetical protein
MVLRFSRLTLGEKIANQNLHATGNYDMILITHPEFAEQAQRLAMLHNNKGDVSVTVVSLPEIYNEFSSGIQDITAIRDFMKMLYDRGMETAQPQYMLACSEMLHMMLKTGFLIIYVLSRHFRVIIL